MVPGRAPRERQLVPPATRGAGRGHGSRGSQRRIDGLVAPSRDMSSSIAPTPGHRLELGAQRLQSRCRRAQVRRRGRGRPGVALIRGPPARGRHRLRRRGRIRKKEPDSLEYKQREHSGQAAQEVGEEHTHTYARGSRWIPQKSASAGVARNDEPSLGRTSPRAHHRSNSVIFPRVASPHRPRRVVTEVQAHLEYR
jgi:hypothetical protein